MAEPDLSEFLKNSRPSRPPCPLGVAAAALEPGAAEQLAAACATDPGVITNGAIVQWLDARGTTTSINAVVHHRKNTCRCGRD